jgi:hypothetical protein
MTITYPIAVPSWPTPSAVNWLMASAVAVSTNPFNYKSQAQHFGGDAWGIELSFDPMYRSEAAPWIAFLAKLRGSFGTFLFGDILMKLPQGPALGTPTVRGANQTGYVLSTQGWLGATSVALKAGDFLQIDRALYQVTADAIPNTSSFVSIDVWPSLRLHADNAPLILSSPQGVFRLVESTVRGIEAPSSQLYTLSFSAEEAL